MARFARPEDSRGVHTAVRTRFMRYVDRGILAYVCPPRHKCTTDGATLKRGVTLEEVYHFLTLFVYSRTFNYRFAVVEGDVHAPANMVGFGHVRFVGKHSIFLRRSRLDFQGNLRFVEYRS